MKVCEVCLGPKLMKCSLGKELDVASIPQRIVMLIPTIREGQQQISKVTSVVGSATDNETAPFQVRSREACQLPRLIQMLNDVI